MVLLAGLIAAACLTSPLSAAFLGLVSEVFEEPEWREHGYEGLRTYRLYAVFDGNGNDGVLSVFGIMDLPLTVRTSNDWFFEDRLGDLTMPDDLRKFGYWSNRWDTFVTINGEFGNDTTGASCGSHGGVEVDVAGLGARVRCLCHGVETGSGGGGWFVTPDDEQSRADADGRVLLGQFTVAENAPGVEFLLNLLLRDGGQIESLRACTAPEQAGGVPAARDCPPPSCLGDIDVDFDADLEDLLAVLVAWGECNGCPADLDCSFVVDVADLLVVLRAWGPCGDGTANAD